MCVYMHHLHIHALHAPLITTKYKIYLVDLPSVLYERSGQNETSVLNQLFLWLSGAFHVLLMKAPLFIQEVPVFMKTFKTRSICVYTCTIYTYMHHQIPPNIRYTLLALPLYSMKDQVKMRHLCWISCFCCFSGAFHVLFMKKCHFSWKPTKPGQYVCIHTFTHTCTTCTTNYHQI